MKSKLISPIQHRYSALAFVPKPIPLNDVMLLFEAARWAPSSYNEQPWLFFYADRDDAQSFESVLSVLMPANKEWAQNASLIVVSTARKSNAKSGDENYYALHDTALAEANLMAQAQAMGLVTHIMGGFSHDKVRSLLDLSDSQVPVTAIAIGYPADISTLSSHLQQRAQAERTRKPIEEIAVKVEDRS